MPRKYASMAERLLANCITSEDHGYNGTRCWEWIGARVTNKSGMFYGKLATRFKSGKRKGQRRTEFAHRVAVKAFRGRRLSIRQVVRHLCNNSLCINPDHLMGGTQRANVRQSVKDGRHKPGTANQHGQFAPGVKEAVARKDWMSAYSLQAQHELECAP